MFPTEAEMWSVSRLPLALPSRHRPAAALVHPRPAFCMMLAFYNLALLAVCLSESEWPYSDTFACIFTQFACPPLSIAHPLRAPIFFLAFAFLFVSFFSSLPALQHHSPSHPYHLTTVTYQRYTCHNYVLDLTSPPPSIDQPCHPSTLYSPPSASLRACGRRLLPPATPKGEPSQSRHAIPSPLCLWLPHHPTKKRRIR
ncbi:hypothetical protein DM02DRAFT_189227 [Periconia macrospinosa]|uniref:Uncharacterized protein n=1 Tax=Periconia macrospinosa TaxID=97972 RepID=A0A2V1D8X3_9PLEO|nr:hypothetical protein DM02DRAFT_189227 [Periconia macrospinosa]